MKRHITLLALTAALLLTVNVATHAQVITDLGRRSMDIPHGDRPDDNLPVTATTDYHLMLDTTSVYYHLVDSAQTFIDTGDLARAEQCLHRAFALDPTNAANSLLLSNLGTIQRMQGKPDEALRTYTLAIDLTPNAVTLLLNRAATHLELGNIAKSISDFQRVRALDETDTESRYVLAMLGIELGQDSLASQCVAELAKIAPGDLSTLEAQAALAKSQGDYSNAIGFYGQAIDKQADAALYSNRADCHLMLRQLTEASEDIANSLAIDPDDGFTYALRAKLNKMRYNYEDMERDIQLAVQHGVDAAYLKELLK